MASCTQVERMFQAHIDGELGQSDRVILEQHMADCPACAALLRKHQRACAHLCEAFVDHRLTHSLVESVLDHVPEMEPVDQLDMEAVNWRLKHPVGRWQRAARLMPAVAGIVLLILALTLMSQWPTPPGAGSNVVGVVTHCSGVVKSSTYDGVTRQAVAVKDFVERGERFETGSGDALMLALAGPTQLKLNENTRIKLFDERKLSVETGEIWLDVGRDGRLFRVTTPMGVITVFGTAFEVAVDGDRTVVTVEEGKVQVENEIAFREVAPGQQVELVSGGPLVPRSVDVASETAWASRINPDHGASVLFAREILSRATGAQLPAQPVWVVKDLNRRAVTSIRLQWEPDSYVAGHTGYDVYVSDDKMQPLFKAHVSGRLFADKDVRSRVIVVPGTPISGVNVLHIRIVPDFVGGCVETSFTKVGVAAVGI